MLSDERPGDGRPDPEFLNRYRPRPDVPLTRSDAHAEQIAHGLDRLHKGVDRALGAVPRWVFAVVGVLYYGFYILLTVLGVGIVVVATIASPAFGSTLAAVFLGLLLLNDFYPGGYRTSRTRQVIHALTYWWRFKLFPRPDYEYARLDSMVRTGHITPDQYAQAVPMLEGALGRRARR